MALKNVTKQVAPAYYRSPGEEVQPGDEATLFLNQDHNPNLPASIPATVLTVSDVIIYTGGCGVNGKSYIFQYDTAALAGEVNFLDHCDIVSASGTSCCEANATAIAELVTAVEDLEEDLDTWDEQVLFAVPTDGSPGVAQVETQTAVGTIATGGTLIATVTGAGITGSPLAISFNVDAGDVPSVWAAKAAAAVGANTAVAALYLAPDIGADFGLTEKVPNGNDATLNLAITAGTATGITPDATSTNTVTGITAVVPVPIPARVGQHALFGKRIWEATSLYAWTELLTERNGIVDFGFTDSTGSSPDNLDSLAVSAVDVNMKVIVDLGSKVLLYELVAGTDAEDIPNVVRPDNYAGGTNEFVWFLRDFATRSASILDASAGGNSAADAGLVALFGTGGTLKATDFLILKSLSTGFTNTFGVTGTATANRSHEAPDVSGVLETQRTVTRLTPVTTDVVAVARYVDQYFDLTPAGTIAALTFNLPAAANSRIGQKVELMSSQIITALTVAVSGGGTIGGAALAAAAVNVSYEYICTNTAPIVWKRIR